MAILGYIVPIVFAFGLLIFIHELGHFLAAKLFRMRVEQFSIGFPPRIIGKTIGDTEYRIGAIPLGGYVKISGMIDESMDTEWVDKDPEPWEFRAKPVWQRMIVISAGVIFNLILAAMIFVGLKWYYGDVVVPADRVESVYVAPGSLAEEIGFRTGDQLLGVNDAPLVSYDDFRTLRALTEREVSFTVKRENDSIRLQAPEDLMSRLSASEGNFGFDWLPAMIGGVVGGSPAAQAGLRPGDRLIDLGGRPVEFWLQLTDELQKTEGETVALRFVRPDSLDTEPVGDNLTRIARIEGASVYETQLTPTQTDGRYVIGVHSPTSDQLRQIFGVQERSYGLGEAIIAGSQEAVNWVGLYGRLLKRLFTGQDNVRESIGGPLLIAKVTKEAADRSMQDFWMIVANLSIALAVFNILPIPVLDGGHLVFLAYEGITRREPSLKVRMAVQQVGLVLILLFMAFVIFNDAMRLF